ncbi:cytochrome c [Sulfurimonas sp. MAG313]|nr:hypothetical protein [Sulfurimonas sp. MAG313]MDF1880922.1 cytochrome c [Sulfurimonas sp. MAG313]
MKKIFLCLVVLTSLIAAEAPLGVNALSVEVRTLLSQEMLSIEASMQRIFSHIVAGEYEAITREASNIQNSFILKKELKASERKELHSKLSSAFIDLDRSFHETAGKLANAAEFDEKENVSKYYTQMTNKCVQCHSTYAKHRFEKFHD